MKSYILQYIFSSKLAHLADTRARYINKNSLIILMISKEMARCLAKVSGDGCLCPKYLGYTNKCKELLKEFKQDITKEFGQVHFGEGKVNSGTNFIYIYKRFIIREFLKYLNDFRSSTIFIPNKIKNANKSIQREYLRALYDDEGSVALRIFKKTKEWKRGITISSNSFRLIKEIKELLKKFNITSNKIIKNSPNDNCYILAISGKENILKFKENINFKHPTKFKRLNLMIKTFTVTSKHKKKFEKLKKELYNLKDGTANQISRSKEQYSLERRWA